MNGTVLVHVIGFAIEHGTVMMVGAGSRGRSDSTPLGGWLIVLLFEVGDISESLHNDVSELDRTSWQPDMRRQAEIGCNGMNSLDGRL